MDGSTQIEGIAPPETSVAEDAHTTPTAIDPRLVQTRHTPVSL
jgi:hypothetical protein